MIKSKEVITFNNESNSAIFRTFNIIKVEGQSTQADADGGENYLVTVLCSNNTYKCLYKIDENRDIIPYGYAIISKEKGFRAVIFAMPYFIISLLFLFFGRSVVKISPPSPP